MVSVEAKENRMAVVDRYSVVLCADISNGTLRFSENLTITGSPPSQPIDPTDTALGSVWALDPTQSLQFNFSLPPSSTNWKVTIAAKPSDTTPVSIGCTANLGTEATTPLAGAALQIADVTPGSLQTGSNTINLRVVTGQVGLQNVKIIYDLPYPALALGADDTATTISMRSPLPEAILPAGSNLSVAWQCTGPLESSLIGTTIQYSNGLVMSLPNAGGTVTPVRQVSLSGAGFDWNLPTTLTGDLTLAIEEFDFVPAAQSGAVISAPTGTMLMGPRLSPRSDFLVCQNSIGDPITLYDLRTSASTTVPQAQGTPLGVPVFSGDSRYLAFASPGKIILLDRAAGTQVLEVPITGLMQNMTLTSQVPSLYFVAGDAAMIVVYLKTICRVDLVAGTNSTIRTLQGSEQVAGFSSDGTLMATSDGTTLRTFNTSNGSQLWTQPSGHVYLVFAPAGDRVLMIYQPAAGGFAIAGLSMADGSPSNQVSFTLNVTETSLLSAVFSPDGKLLALAMQYNSPPDSTGIIHRLGKIHLLDPDSGASKLDADGLSYYCLSFSPEGRFLFYDATVVTNVGVINTGAINVLGVPAATS